MRMHGVVIPCMAMDRAHRINRDGALGVVQPKITAKSINIARD